MGASKIIRYGLPFSNVTANGVATCQVTPGRTLQTIRLELGGTTFTKAMITNLRVKANGKIIIEGSGTQIDNLNAYRGQATSANFLDISFLDLTGFDVIDRYVGAFDTSIGIANITIEVTIAGATAPTLQAILIESAAQKDRQGNAAGFAPLIAKILKYPFSQATGGRLAVTLPFGPQSGSVIKRVHVFNGGNISDVTVKEDGIIFFEQTVAENTFRLTQAGRVVQTNCYTIDFVDQGEVSNALNTTTSKSIEWLLNFSAADSGEILVEYLDPLGNL
jgi:hypothetical protein